MEVLQLLQWLPAISPQHIRLIADIDAGITLDDYTATATRLRANLNVLESRAELLRFCDIPFLHKDALRVRCCILGCNGDEEVLWLNESQIKKILGSMEHSKV
ncbi:hypothetical protein Slin15195_G100640 [Septoria linicola]|uniref:Uncharacterized protein n=1 Tax=Septoria linicola TaxID=215465 RepID=A0A9Q9EN62_9PEZI|nr:hypothetical protein Slin15195_G100640 [Septoria linicola]